MEDVKKKQIAMFHVFMGPLNNQNLNKSKSRLPFIGSTCRPIFLAKKFKEYVSNALNLSTFNKN